MDKATKRKLTEAIKRNLKAGVGPCTAARRACAALGISNVGVQGDDSERLDHVELWITDGDSPSPVLAIDLTDGVWQVR